MMLEKNLFKKYKNCVYCGSHKLLKDKNQFFPKNFYIDAIMHDLNISEKMFRKIKVYSCSKCEIRQNSPWFTYPVSRKIYSEIYGQHNKNWVNLLNFIKKTITPNHGDLFKKIKKNLKIKTYAEFNSPFMGFFLNFFSEEYKVSKSFYKKIYELIIEYFNTRQLAGHSKKKQNFSFNKSKKIFKKIQNIKKKYQNKNKIRKLLFIDNSNLSWGQSDIHRSVNSKSFGSKLLDLEILDLNENNKNYEIDLFGFFHTLDHTFYPKKSLEFALNNSRYVLICCHADKSINKQHLFILTNGFFKYLNKQKINTIDLTEKINKSFKSPELYFLCSKNSLKNINI